MDIKKITEILDQDPKALELLKSFKEAAIKYNANPKEYDAAMEVCLLLAIHQNKDAFQELSNQVWECLNQPPTSLT